MSSVSAEQSEHALSVLLSVNDMRLEEFMCDFKVIVGRETFNVHRLVLAANSGYFKSLFSSNMKEIAQGFVTINSMDSGVIKQCIQYMYTSCCAIETGSVSDILEASNFLQIFRLEEKCFKFFLDNLSTDNSLSVLQLANAYNRDDVKNAAERIAQNNLEVVIFSEGFQKLTKEDVLRIIEKADCKVAWDAITSWCLGREEDFLWFVGKTDFAKYPFTFLLEVVLQEPLVKSQNLESKIIQGLFSDEISLKLNLNVKNCIKIYRYAGQYLEIIGFAPASFQFCEITVDEKNMNIIRLFMEKNFADVISCHDFCSLSVKELKILLNSSNVTSEESKWRGILIWVESDVIKRKVHFASLFNLLQLKKFPFPFLRDLSQDKLVQEDKDCLKVLVDALFDRKLDQKNDGDSLNTSEFSGDDVRLNKELEEFVASRAVGSPCSASPSRPTVSNSKDILFFNNIKLPAPPLKTHQLRPRPPILLPKPVLGLERKKISLPLPGKNLTMQTKMFSGNYSDIYKGMLNGATEVAVKTLKNGTITKKEFLREVETLKILQHENIVGFYCEILDGPVSFVLEFMHHGDLKKYLQSGKVATFRQQINIASQVAAGLAFMETKKCVHRCILAANILVNRHRECKISSFRMARFVGDGDCKAKNGEMLPVKWTAPEIFLCKNFTTKSDVWSFGVLLYEIITMGGIPYPGLTNKDVVAMSGYIMQQPSNCPRPFYELMLQCWHEEPLRRPTFEFLQGFLEDYFNATEERWFC